MRKRIGKKQRELLELIDLTGSVYKNALDWRTVRSAERLVNIGVLRHSMGGDPGQPLVVSYVRRT